MAVYYHLGSSGAGKTTGIQEKIIKEAEADRNRSFLFIVPEQFTLQTQREILEKSSAHGMYNIDALSFNRLCHRVFEEQGLSLPQVLEDTGKSMIVKKVVLEHRDELTVYKSKVKKQGFIEEMKSLIAEFYQYGIDLEKLDEMSELAGDRKILKAKLHDIRIIYEAFKTFIDGRFVMNEEVLDRMCDIAASSELLKNAVVVLDGFTGFTPSQYNCLNSMMKYCADIHVVLSVSKKEAEKMKAGNLGYDGSLFELSIKTVKKLEELSIKNRVPSEYIIYDDEHGRFRDNKALAHLEQNIFRFPYTKIPDTGVISLLSASDLDEEAGFVTAKIRELVFENKIKYDRIAVLTGDLEAYSGVLERKFKTAGIPLFIDTKHSISGTGIVDLIDSVLDVSLTGYSYESIFRFLKTGLTGIERNDIALTENYVLALGIKGEKRWKSVWKKVIKEPDMVKAGKKLEKINEIRNKATELLSVFCDLEKNNPTVKERLTALYRILDILNIEEQLYTLSQKLKESTDTKERIKGVEYGQLFKTVITVFERINGLLGNEKMELSEFKDVLDTGFDEAKLRRIPGGTDSVVIGDMERTRIDNKYVIFFVGCNDSIIPKNTSKEGLLNEFDRELFFENEIELSPTKREAASLGEFYLYLALTKPSERLYITYARTSSEEKEMRPAYLFGRIMKLYDNMEIKRISKYETDNPYRILGSDRGLTVLTGYIREKRNERESDPVKKAIRNVLEEEFNKEAPKMLNLMYDAASGRRNRTDLNKEDAEKLYGTVIAGSITRLQRFAGCAFSYFAEYGLGLKERKEYRIGSLEIGDIYHLALQNYAVGLKKDGLKWTDCEKGDRDNREDKAIEDALTEYNEIINESRRLEYFKKSLKRVISRTVDTVTGQISLGEFDVGYVEKKFTHETSVMKLNGKIDRLDVVKKKGKTYIRVIDYKTGYTKFDMDLVKAGLQLQLAIYMTEAIAGLKESGEDPEAAGMYYYRIDDPIIEAGKDTEKERMRALMLDGLTVDEPEIIGLHDSTLIGENGERLPEKSDIINYRCTKEGTLYKGCEKYVIPKEDFDNVSRTASKKAGELAVEILSGKTAVNPYENDRMTPCTYCSFAGVCGFDRKQGDSYRKL